MQNSEMDETNEESGRRQRSGSFKEQMSEIDRELDEDKPKWDLPEQKKKYQDPLPFRFLLSLWYITYLYTIVIILGFSKTPYANYTVQDMRGASVWAGYANETISTLERIAPGSTRGISLESLESVPAERHTYYLYHFGLCRENDVFEKTCYKGEGFVKLIARDLAVQVAERSGVGDMEGFISHWDEGYSTALKEAKESIKNHTHCTQRSPWTLFSRRCALKGINKNDLRRFQTIEAFSKRSFATELWIAATVLFSILLVVDVIYTLFHLRSDVLAACYWWIFVVNFVIMWIYIIQFEEPERYLFWFFKKGYLHRIFGIVLALQTLILVYLWSRPESAGELQGSSPQSSRGIADAEKKGGNIENADSEKDSENNRSNVEEKRQWVYVDDSNPGQ